MLRHLLVVLVIVYAGACLLLYLLQRSLLYFPAPAAARNNTLTLNTSAGPVLVATRPSATPQAIIYFGGNAEDVSYSLPEYAEAFPAHALYALHYRGYGGSAGRPSEDALHADALALYDLVQANHSGVTLIGRSLGSGLAVRLATLRPARRLILITPYDSILGVAQKNFPLFPVRWLLHDTYESGRYAPAITIPTQIIAAEHDEIIPRASTELLHTRFQPGIATYSVIPGADHNTISESAAFWQQLR